MMNNKSQAQIEVMGVGFVEKTPCMDNLYFETHERLQMIYEFFMKILMC